MFKQRAKLILTRNWKTKAVSILSAGVLWFIISLNQSSIVNYPNKIKIDFTGLGENLVSVASDDSVQVKINADPIKLKSLNDENFKATIDLSGLGEGVYEKEVKITSAEPKIQVISSTPKKTTVKIDKRATKKVPVRVKYEGATEDGLIVSDTSADPSEVEIVGPKSTIDTISEAVAPIKISQEKESFEKVSNLFLFDAQGNQIKFIKISPDSVKAKVTIGPAGETKTVGIKVNTTGDTESGYWVKSITTDPQVITVSGSRTKLSQIQYVETEEIDISALNTTKTFTTKLKNENGIIINEKYSSIKVIIEAAKNENVKSISVIPHFNNLQTNFKLSSIEPSAVEIKVTGDSVSLSQLKSADFALNIDLSKYQKGTHEIDLQESNFTLPNSLKLIELISEKIKITVE